MLEKKVTINAEVNIEYIDKALQKAEELNNKLEKAKKAICEIEEKIAVFEFGEDE